MSLCVNDDGLTFSAWHEKAGYTITFMSRCDLRFFAMLHRAWRFGSDPKHWIGKIDGTQLPWN